MTVNEISKKIQEYDLNDPELHDYLVLCWRYFIFDHMTKYRKEKRVVVDEPQPYNQKKHPSWMVRKASVNHYVYPKELGLERTPDSRSLVETVEYFTKVTPYIIKQAKEAGYDLYHGYITGGKLRDGKNGIYYEVYVDFYEFNTEDKIRRYTRSTFKNIIGMVYEKWRSENKVRACYSTILPSNLLSKMIEKNITLDNSLRRLHDARVKEGAKKLKNEKK